MPRINLSTKGKTLEDLAGVVTKARILKVFRFTVGSFVADGEGLIQAIRDAFKDETLIVRSSAKNEDNLSGSNAGHYKSIAGVPKDNVKRLRDAVMEVIASYRSEDLENEVLVQPMLKGIKMFGVAFTADLDTLAPYYIINYDESGRSDTVTGGSERAKTYIHFKDCHAVREDVRLSKVIEACRELECLSGNDKLDIEFALDSNDSLYLLQCRPIATMGKDDLSKVNLKDSIKKLYEKIETLSSKHPNLLGDRTIFGVMPDWNPAEIIGLKPKQLALSLYKELVTDNVWAYQRDNYGYRNLRSHPLMISLLGVPYIDVRVDFNSFIPKDLNEQIAKKLIDYYLDKLHTSPKHHDKIEFEVVHSCYYLNLPARLKELTSFGFNENEIKRIEFSLLDLTNNVIDPEHGLCKADLKKIEVLKDKFDNIVNSELPVIEKIYWLIEDCKRFGTLPFAGVARAAFIGVQFLKSFVDIGIMTQYEYDSFMNSINTVAKKLNTSLTRVSGGNMTKEEFLREFGHLRPNTYDIMSYRYDESFDHYFSSINRAAAPSIPFDFSKKQLEGIDLLLSENGLKTDALGLLRFIREAIEGREYAKFVFTRSLSEVLKFVEGLGKDIGLERADLAHLDIRTVMNLYSTLDHRDIKDVFSVEIERNKEIYNYTKAIKLPSLIRKAEDVYAFHLEDEEPNFITLRKVEAGVITEGEFKSCSFDRKIAFIKSADPGYDFLFTKNISGLVTQFGGANSHMAIRCAELSIPAVIGAGEKNFSEWSKAKYLEVDCANRQVKIIS